MLHVVCCIPQGFRREALVGDHAHLLGVCALLPLLVLSVLGRLLLREWTLARYHLPDVEGVVEGNYRGEGENPQRVPGGEEGTMFFFRDEWGTLHSCLDSERRNAVTSSRTMRRNSGE